MRLTTIATGRGQPLVMLHGWGLHAGIWNHIAALLGQRYRCIAIDLPGHGESPALAGGLEEWAEACRAAAPPGALWLGWSLGGIVALEAALQAPGDIGGLMLVSTTPRFVTAPDWPHAVAPETLARFAGELRRDWRATIEGFLTLQTLGGASGSVVLRTLRRELFARGEPDPAGLSDGLSILETADLRARLAQLTLPTCVLAGKRDRLTPPAAGRALATALRGEFQLSERDAHAPFLAHPEAFADRLDTFARRAGDTAARAG